jgi:hypothetical protein
LFLEPTRPGEATPRDLPRIPATAGAHSPTAQDEEPHIQSGPSHPCASLAKASSPNEHPGRSSKFLTEPAKICPELLNLLSLAEPPLFLPNHHERKSAAKPSPDFSDHITSVARRRYPQKKTILSQDGKTLPPSIQQCCNRCNLPPRRDDRILPQPRCQTLDQGSTYRIYDDNR